MSKSQKRDLDGRWFRCPMEGCDFCHYDFLQISSDRMHMARAHPGYNKDFKQLWNARVMISEAEGLQWKASHPEAYREWRKREDYVPGKNARPRPGKNADTAPAPGAGRAPTQANHLQHPPVVQGQQTTTTGTIMPSVPVPEHHTPASNRDAMEIDTPSPTQVQTPAPESEYSHKWKCYACNRLYTARQSVERHFLSSHRRTHHLFQPSRVPKLAFDKTTGKLVKLVNDVPQRPSFTGLCAELRQLIFEQVLSISQHPEQTEDVFYHHALQLPGELSIDAAAALKHSNLFIRVTIYYSDAEDEAKDRSLARSLSREIKAVLEPNIADRLDLDAALDIMIDHSSAVNGPKVSSSFLFAYNEGIFAELVRDLIMKEGEIGALSIRFRSGFATPRHGSAAADVFRYLGYLRLPVRVATYDVMSLVDTRGLKQRIQSDFSTHSGVINLLKQLMGDAEDFMQQKDYSRSLATLRHAACICYDDHVLFSEDPNPWRNAIDDLCCRINLAACQVINTMTSEAFQEGRPQSISVDALVEAAVFWGGHAFEFSVISHAFRGQAHLGRGIANKHLAKYLKQYDVPPDDGRAAEYRFEARKDFFFATMLLEGEELQAAKGELALLDYYDNEQTTGEIAGLVSGHPIPNGQVFTGDRRLLEDWEGEELDLITERRQRPPGWDWDVRLTY